MVNGLRVAVVGGGIAGLSVAAFLCRAGIASTVYEQAAGPVEEGAGIQLSPNGTRLLHRAGLAGHLSRHAVRPEAVEVRHWRGDRILARTELGTACVARYGAPYYTLRRARLRQGLLDLVTGNGLTAVRTGRRVVGIAELPDQVRLRFADGSVAGADLLIGADGLHSVVRRALVTDRIRYSGLTVRRGLVRAGRLPGVGNRVLVWLGPDRHVVCYPLPDGWVNVVAIAPHVGAAYADWPDTVRAAVAELGPPVARPLYDRAPLARWRTRRIALAGDAAHPLLPFAAQGANQAIEDAATLAAVLGTGAAGVPAALDRYERVRLPRLARVRDLIAENVADPDAPVRPAEGLAAREWLYAYDAERAA
ncbi:MAG: hypothetical protein AUI10_03805 [Actinobacteria bacterium 13_2_20CM_2_72_6]|nr:MAG: hypothetical protein AUI10_03805 [Actinobacteria bacterium 13_2_20CM_2_72_6]